MIRALLAAVLPYPERFRAALKLARLGRPFARLFEAVGPLRPLAAMLRLAPTSIPQTSAKASPAVYPAAAGARHGRVAILTGCAQPVLDPGINEAAISLLTRLGVEVVAPQGEGCCGALVHHMGREGQALASARQNVDAWMREIESGGLDAIIITASGCGTTIKDYGFMLRLDPAYAQKAAKISALAKDITEYLATLDLPEPAQKPGLTVAYHSACSMQHGQRVHEQPRRLLRDAGFSVAEIGEGHICCGSAGTYNIFQAELAGELRERKLDNIAATKPDCVATGNIGCITQLSGNDAPPIVHTVELLDWAYNGNCPRELAHLQGRMRIMSEQFGGQATAAA
jgi:glycolate oxidase iron-sulfur subunit